MTLSVLKLLDPAAVSGGEASLAHIDLVSQAPPGASEFALHLAAALPAVIARAQAAQYALAPAVMAVTTLRTQRKQKLKAARAAEKTLDAAFSGGRNLLIGASKVGSIEAEILDGLLYPGGSVAFSAPRLRAQVGKYLSWFVLADSAAVRSNPAYDRIAAEVEDFRARFGAFTTLVQEKEALDAALTAACTARDQARGSWDTAFTDLIDTVAKVHGEQSDAFRAWSRPIRDLKAAKAASRTRRTAKTPGEAV